MPEKIINVYVKSTSNCKGLPLQIFERLSPEWTDERLTIPFGPDREPMDVVGWTDLYNGCPCNVHVVHARWIPHRHGISGGPDVPQEGYLVWGGNSGVRILDDEAEPVPGVDDHLPAGYGRPIVWVADAGDFPPEVQDVIERHVCGACGTELPASKIGRAHV